MPDGPLLQKSLTSSFNQLWSHSALWRITLLGTGIATAIFLMFPPWQSDKSQVVPTIPLATKTASVSHGRDGHTTPVASPVPGQIVHERLMPKPDPAANLLHKLKPATKPALVRHQVEHSSRSAKFRHDEDLDSATSPVIDPPALEAVMSAPEKGISSEIVTADQNCNNAGPMRASLNAPLPVQGQILGFVPPQQVIVKIPKDEEKANGKMDPQYVHDLMVVIRPAGQLSNKRPLVMVPGNMHVYVGERVWVVGGHASPDLACHFIPNSVIKKSL